MLLTIRQVLAKASTTEQSNAGKLHVQVFKGASGNERSCSVIPEG